MVEGGDTVLVHRHTGGVATPVIASVGIADPDTPISPAVDDDPRTRRALAPAPTDLTPDTPREGDTLSHTTTTRSPRHRCVLAALAATALALVSPAVLAPEPAAAGTYEVKTCDDGAGSSEGWEIREGNSNMAASKSCPSNGDQRRGLYVRTTDTSVSTGQVSIRFDAPRDTRLRELKATLRVANKDADRGGFGVGVQDQNRSRRFGCEADRCVGNVPGGGPGGRRETIDLGAASFVEVFVSCQASGTFCRFNGSGSDVYAALYGATVVVEDGTDPDLKVRGGSLAAGANPVQKRTADVVFDATDNTGIRSARLLVDGNEVAFDRYSYDETKPVPAENRSNGRLAVDTRELSDGPHTAQLVVVDSAGNEQSHEKSIIVDNGTRQGGNGGGSRDADSPRGGSGGGGGGGGGGGSGGGSSGTGGGPAIGASPLGLDSVSFATSRAVARNGSSVLFTGQVLDGGLPAANALVAVQARVGRRWVTFKIVRTDAFGNFASRYRFKRTRRSTRYQFRAHVAAQASLTTVDSTPRIVTVSPRRR